MNTFKNLHPLTLFCYFFCVLFISVFSFNPAYLAVGFIGAVLYGARLNGIAQALKSMFGYFLIILIVTVTNPLFSHNGATALFFINDNRVTLEALIYGAVTGLAIAEALIWFSCFNRTFDSEKLLYIFGRISPKTALVVSMALSFIPRFVKTFHSVNESQKSLPVSRVRRFICSFSAVITQSMEGAIITSDSMKARGYNQGKRTFYSRFVFTVYDGAYLAAAVLFAVLSLVSVVSGSVGFKFYPYFVMPELSVSAVLGFCAFSLLALMPFVFEIKEDIKWKYSVSKI